MSWLSPPKGPDEETTRIARVVHVVGIGIILAVLPPILSNLAVGNWQPVLVLLVEQSLAAICLVLNHRGAVRLASRLLALSAIGLATSLQIAGRHGVHDISILIYPGAIIVAGALFERRWFVIFTVLTMATFALQYGLELGGVVTNQLSDHSELRLLVDAEVILGVSALGVGLLMGSLRRSMAQAQAAAASLRESEQLYRSLFEAVTEGIIVFDLRDNRIVDVNPRITEWFGYTPEDLRLLSAEELSSDVLGFTGEETSRRLDLAAQGAPQLFEWQARARDGRLFWVEVSTRAALVGGRQRLLISLRDIDERKRAAVEKQRLEEQLRQAQKLESIGRLAGGIAHDFNNLLTCVLGNVDLGLTVCSSSHPIRENLQEIRHAARRAAELTSQLLAFSRKQPIAPVLLDPKNVLSSVDRMLRRLLGETIAIHTYVEPDIGRIRADPGQIEQILVNLAVNARDAMPNGGRLSIAAANHDVDESFLAANPGASTGQFVRIVVTDTGTGMSEEVQQHIFEPFFTTKAMGKGTGLGLAMVFGAMEQNHGFILLRSQPGQGSSFELFFPRFFGEAKPISGDAKLLTMPGGSEHVLLVEDDPSVRQLSQRLLEHLGYHVVVCETATIALAASHDAEKPFDLLVTDLILPDLDGRALAKQLVEQCPGLKVLYCSGYMEDVIAHRGVLEEGLAFLPKPFTAEAMARKVRAVLDEGRSELRST